MTNQKEAVLTVKDLRMQSLLSDLTVREKQLFLTVLAAFISRQAEPFIYPVKTLRENLAIQLLKKD